MEKQITLVDVAIMWMVAICALGIIFFAQSQENNNMTDYKGGQSECRKEYLGE